MDESGNKRIDVILTERGMAESRSKAQQLIREGKVFVDKKAVTKVSALFGEEAEITLQGELPKYVGRGGLKLEGAIESFHPDLRGKTCIDIGASTGGFTDCMLSYGAKRVYAVDVGTSQLHPKLREDHRVISLENLDARSAIDRIPEKAGFIAVDVSFISLKLIIPAIKELLSEDGEAILLIKPQFEVGRAGLNKHGIVRDPHLRQRAATEICDFSRSLGFAVDGPIPSPITGGDGNEEFLIFIKNKVKL